VPDLKKVLGVSALVAVGVAGAAYGIERAIARSVRRRGADDLDVLGPLPFDEHRVIPAHDGGTLATWSRGDGPALLLSHGVTITSRTWVRQFAELPEHGLRTVAFDHRGHGASSVGDSGYSIGNLGWDVRTVLERLDLRDAIVVGHSMGGVAALAFATRFPEVARQRVRGLVLVASLARAATSRVRAVRGAADRLAGRAPSIVPLLGHPDVGLAIARVGFGRAPVASHVELVRSMLAECSLETQREALRALLDLDLVARLPEITIPTLVVSGTADVITPPAESRVIASAIPGARLVVLDGVGHMPMLERAEEFDALLVGFAREIGVLPAIDDGAEVPAPIARDDGTSGAPVAAFGS
jgi:pimeloyl-ACP methyl ester carboxylesterase